MSDTKQQIARAFAYTGATLMVGVVVYFFTQGLIPFVELPDIAGSVFLIGFILIFLNLSFAMGRRFCSRTFEMERFPFILALVLVLPTWVLSLATERFSGTGAATLFLGVITFASVAGALLGIRSGGRKRDKLIREALETGGAGAPGS
jgi:hypothetical protein